jgi:dTDP-4-dehydrorhamnose reductase
MKILITGGSGQLGRALQRALESQGVEDLGRPELDVTDPYCIETWFEEERPDMVVHCAAMTDTRACEDAPQAARGVNAEGSGHVAAACAAHGARLIVISTNEVFDGVSTAPRVEDDAPRPVSAYGDSKLLGEQLAATAHPSTAFVRTAWLYGDGPNNFVAKVLAAARERRPLRYVTDEIATPTNADDLAVAIRQLIELPDAPPGIYHLTNEGEASRYEWAREIVRLAGLDESRVEPITTAQLRAGGYDGPRKPPYSVLANTRARALGITLRPWREALAAYFERAPVAADG